LEVVAEERRCGAIRPPLDGGGDAMEDAMIGWKKNGNEK